MMTATSSHTVAVETERTDREVSVPSLDDKRTQKQIGKLLHRHGYECTDVGQRDRFVALHGDEIRFTAAGCYYWDGQKWSPDEGQCITTDLVINTALATRLEAAEEKGGNSRYGELSSWAVKCESTSKVKAVIELISRDTRLRMQAADFNADKMVFNVQNGTIDLSTGKLQPHKREDYITHISPVAYDPNVECPMWARTVDEWGCGDPDWARYFQMFFGYALTGHTTEQIVDFFEGVGANGKSVAGTVLPGILGTYASTIPFDSLLQNPNTDGGRARSDLAGLLGKRLVIGSESDAGARLSPSLFKSLTGGDPITVRKLYKDFFTYTPEFKLVLMTNRLPRIADNGHAVWRRVKVLPFRYVVPDDKRNPHLAQELLEKESAGILNWLIAGCLMWQAKGRLPEIQSIVDATNSYREGEDIFGAFLLDCCRAGEGLFCASSQLRQVYTGWCDELGHVPVKGRSFGAHLKEHGFADGRQGGKRGWFGIETLSAYDRV